MTSIIIPLTHPLDVILIALMRDDVTNFSGYVKVRLGGERFAWFVYDQGEIINNCGLFVAFCCNASLVYCLRPYKFSRHGSQKVLASLTTAKQRVAIQIARENTANKHASE